MLFNEKLDLKLINLVKENSVLYDHNHAKYMDFNAREVAWQKIGDELKRPAADCKVRWINIRDVNRRILRKCLNNPGQRIRMYKYDSELAFMRPYYRDVPIKMQDYDFDEEADKDDDMQMNNDFDHQELDPELLPESSDPEIVEKKRKSKGKRPKSVRKKKKRAYMDDVEEKPETSVFTEAVAAMPQEFDPSDPVDAFLLSIGATLKTFTPYHLNLAKTKIFSVVQEHDLQQIVQRQRDDHNVEQKITTSHTINFDE